MKAILGLVVVGMIIIALVFGALLIIGSTDITHSQWNTHCIREHGADTVEYFTCLAQAPSWDDN